MQTRQILYRLISCRATALYLVTIITIFLLFPDHRLNPLWLAWGIVAVLGFFFFSYFLYNKWKENDSKTFIKKLFWVALFVRILYVVGMCYYYYFQTGLPFEYEAADSLTYHRQGIILSRLIRSGDFDTLLKYLNGNSVGFSDKGYPLYLSLIYTVFGRNILTPRIFKSLLSAAVCVAVYKLTSRSLDEKTAKMAGIFCLLQPTLIHYTGLHTKETEMMFFAIFALERLDYLLRSKKFNFWNIAIPILFTSLVFGFRTFLGVVIILSFVVFTLLSPDLLNMKSKIIVIVATCVVFLVFLFTGIGNEMKIIIKLNFFSHNYMVEKYEEKGLGFSEYAQSKYLAPGVLFLPLSSMVSVANDNQKLMNGSAFVNNVMAFFALWAVVIAIREKKLRHFSLIGTFVFSYLFILAFSFSVMSERYHFPVLPILMILAAYALTHFRKKDLKFFNLYLCLLFIALIAWNYIKLAGRGLI